ncbi:hypothetical protein O1D97_12340 [Marinomonas sp. 15G1-11]|uniref:Uncharacterized protein n=1 Tax=Marinomonas phaeophyticola TaxID=3004091 RepID=A0ABT4JVH9_9GAMM|nr:hypothetical protein [Marinomonas sp. 15G1-11]MCZ2722391.1 hypothetical protein [Marinomonas sp. 15G1-11]
MTTISLKTQNIVPLSILIGIQLIVVWLVNQKELDLSQLSSLKETGILMGVIGVLAGFLSSLLPTGLKNTLVFLRWRHALPGHRFIQLAEKDSRIDNAALKTAVADYEFLKTDHETQNGYWYRKIYKPLSDQKDIASTHKSYLLYRDAVAISFLSTIIFIIAKILIPNLMVDINFDSVFVFFVGGGGFIVAANNLGRRLVTTSIAVYISML